MKDSVHYQRIAQDYHRNVRYIHQIYNERFGNETLIHLHAIPFEFWITEINLEAVAHGLKLKSIVEFQNVRECAYNRIPIGSLRELALLKERVNKYKRNADLAQDGDMI